MPDLIIRHYCGPDCDPAAGLHADLIYAQGARGQPPAPASVERRLAPILADAGATLLSVDLALLDMIEESAEGAGPAAAILPDLNVYRPLGSDLILARSQSMVAFRFTFSLPLPDAPPLTGAQGVA